ncbi:MAG: hypothetical protein EOO47_16225 [Flavobacterium sp.]|nr:MAG: hypothetical protein EOO47_16225 [Flavobacterium sp.]
MRNIKFAAFFVTALFLSYPAFSQRFEVGVNAGGSSYLGDLNQYNPVKISGLNAGAFVKLNFDPHWGLGFHYNYGKIKANDATSKYDQLKERNLNFSNSLNELSLLLDFNLFDLYSHNGRRKFTPYIFLGGGVVIFDPTTEYKGEEYKLRLYNTEGQAESYKKYAITIPYGVGVRHKLKEQWTVFSQIGYRTAFTDYLDDVSGVYPQANAWDNTGTGGISKPLSDRSGEQTGNYIGEPGLQRGDFRKRDTYMFVGIGITYTFVSAKCFTF